MKLTKEQRFGVISSIIFLVFFTGVLLMFGFSSPIESPEEEGILINFGTNETGSGMVEPRPIEEPIQQESVPEPVSTPQPTTTSDNTEELLTQDFDKTAVLEEKKRKERENQDEIKRKEEEHKLEIKRQEEIEKQRLIDEEKERKEQQQEAINNRAKNAFGGQNPDGDNTGEGNTGGTGNQGSPDGDVNSNNRNGGPGGGNGISFSLNGRSSNLLPAPPKIHNTEGKVVVEVTVDQDGRVIKARSGVKGTTISDEELWKAAKQAALKATFNVNKNAPAAQKGTITYLFGFE